MMNNALRHLILVMALGITLDSCTQSNDGHSRPLSVGKTTGSQTGNSPTSSSSSPGSKDSMSQDPNTGVKDESESIVTKTPFTLTPFTVGYPSLQEIRSLLGRWESETKGFLKVFTYGPGNNYFGFRMGGNKERTSPRILITAATHGDEFLSTATVLGVMDRLLRQYAVDQEMTETLETREIVVIPVACPEGYSAGSREVMGIDPNRAFPTPDSNGTPVGCTQAIIALFEQEKFDATIDYHAFGELIMYPWAKEQAATDQTSDVRYRDLAARMAASGNYEWGQISNILYPAVGSSADFYHFRGRQLGKETIALAVEVGTSKRPVVSAIKPEIDANEKHLKLFIKDSVKSKAYSLVPTEAPMPPPITKVLPDLE